MPVAAAAAAAASLATGGTCWPAIASARSIISRDFNCNWLPLTLSPQLVPICPKVANLNSIGIDFPFSPIPFSSRVFDFELGD